MIERLEPVEQWFWVRNGMFGAWEYNEHAVSGRLRGTPMPEEDFVLFEPVGRRWPGCCRCCSCGRI
jgi:hypothetical protein